MRFIGGRHRGTALAAVGGGDPDARLRPTSDRVRESLFNLIAHGGYADPPVPEDARVLDLFAGTGALGLEAISRGAAHVTFVDNGSKALGILRMNVARLGAEAETAILRLDATRLGLNRDAPFDLIFLDPPYGKSLGERALDAAGRGGWIAPGALVVWEESTPVARPPGLTPRDARRYGDTMISILTADT